MLKWPSYEKTIPSVAPRSFEFETPGLNGGSEKFVAYSFGAAVYFRGDTYFISIMTPNPHGSASAYRCIPTMFAWKHKVWTG